ncbi:MAG: CDP-alcohol phosphatidyltransferase family protein [Verrucomicrobia bacterium]|nr:CDP-alcohol phosphatidyltransferase family protein [Verrucomicrobiota bacterium]
MMRHLAWMVDENSARRPLKSRGTTWAGTCSRVLLRLGLRPNTVSLLSLLFAAGAGVCLFLTPSLPQFPWIWLVAAACVQIRLLCNLMDGMLAVEGGLKSPTGELFNELPDRLADALILAPLGYAEGSAAGIALGWAAACGAIGTAYIRAMGASLTGENDFRGPMAKPHRMATVTAACIGMLCLEISGQAWPLLFWALVFINAGILITGWRRVSRLASNLKSKPSP